MRHPPAWSAPDMPWSWWGSFVLSLVLCFEIAREGQWAFGFFLGTVVAANRVLHLIFAGRWGRWR